jgi:hypothetical protein
MGLYAHRPRCLPCGVPALAVVTSSVATLRPARSGTTLNLASEPERARRVLDELVRLGYVLLGHDGSARGSGLSLNRPFASSAHAADRSSVVQSPPSWSPSSWHPWPGSDTEARCDNADERCVAPFLRPRAARDAESWRATSRRPAATSLRGRGRRVAPSAARGASCPGRPVPAVTVPAPAGAGVRAAALPSPAAALASATAAAFSAAATLAHECSHWTALLFVRVPINTPCRMQAASTRSATMHNSPFEHRRCTGRSGPVCTRPRRSGPRGSRCPWSRNR